MERRLEIDRWSRRHHYEFFKDYDRPFFNVCAAVDVGRLYDWSKQSDGPSFFLGSLYLALTAVNAIEPFRYRIRDDAVVIHDVVHSGTTVLRQDETFGFAYFEYRSSYAHFETEGREILDRARRASGPLQDRPERDDVIHTSVIPWVYFTGFSHAGKLGVRDSIPKVVFGKHEQREGTRRMPVSVEVHHALMDGLHVGRFFERYQAMLEEPQLLET